MGSQLLISHKQASPLLTSCSKIYTFCVQAFSLVFACQFALEKKHILVRQLTQKLALCCFWGKKHEGNTAENNEEPFLLRLLAKVVSLSISPQIANPKISGRENVLDLRIWDPRTQSFCDLKICNLWIKDLLPMLVCGLKISASLQIHTFSPHKYSI
jgi:hypothetical protein